MHNTPHTLEAKQKISAAYTSRRKQEHSERMKQLWKTTKFGRKRLYPKERAAVFALRTYQRRHIAQGLCVECSNPICDLYANRHCGHKNRRCEECYRKHRVRSARRALKQVHGNNVLGVPQRQVGARATAEVAADLLTGLVMER